MSTAIRGKPHTRTPDEAARRTEEPKAGARCLATPILLEMSESIVLIVGERSVPARVGRSLFNELTNAGVVVATACGGKGSCHLCRVRVLSEEASHGAPLPGPPSPLERSALGNVLLAQGWRLSCQVTVTGPMKLALPPPRAPRSRSR